MYHVTFYEFGAIAKIKANSDDDAIAQAVTRMNDVLARAAIAENWDFVPEVSKEDVAAVEIE